MGVAGAFPSTARAEWDVETATFLVLLNEYRQQNGAGPLALDAKLQRAADWHSNDQLNTAKCAEQRPFTCSHTDSQGRSPGTRARDQFAYTGNVGENINWGARTSVEALESWKKSPGHNQNMLTPGYTATGIGRVCNGGSCFWTQKFGGAVSEPFAAPPIPGVPANFTGTWTGQWDLGRVFTAPITLTQNGDQVTGTVAINFTTMRPVTGAEITQLQGRVVAGTPKLMGTFRQPAAQEQPERTGTFELTLRPDGSVDGAWASLPNIFPFQTSPKAAADAPPAPPAPPAPATAPQPKLEPQGDPNPALQGMPVDVNAPLIQDEDPLPDPAMEPLEDMGEGE